MPKADLAKLSVAHPRDAWPDEARDFTPWLFENINHLSEVLGIDLEAVETEVSIENFSADIVATDVRTGYHVLIENQLEKSDHKHLGQIMTYLAGTEARSIVWISPEFQEAHLSAIGWLNEHTASGFAFFAVRLRVVQIENSPFAPMFEVIEQPNNWERNLRTYVAEAESELTSSRRQFWDRYIQLHGGDRLGCSGCADSNVWIDFPDQPLVLSMFVGKKSGMFLRGKRGDKHEDVKKTIDDEYGKKLTDALSALKVSQSPEKGHYYCIESEIALKEKDRWDELIGWMEEQRKLYEEAIQD
ncbi:MAG: hypothetical protein OXG03_03280 [Gammaproteobacteria bacterium]|nr:hypothetical protein [Gammaproteobacteria bacterium]